MAESEEELKSLFMRVKEESEKAGLKLDIRKTKIMVLSGARKNGAICIKFAIIIITLLSSFNDQINVLILKCIVLTTGRLPKPPQVRSQPLNVAPAPTALSNPSHPPGEGPQGDSTVQPLSAPRPEGLRGAVWMGGRTPLPCVTLSRS